MLKGIVQFFKNIYEACTGLHIWLFNICSILVGVGYWASVDYENPSLGGAVVTLVAFSLMGAVSLWVFLRDDEEMRLYQASENIEVNFPTEKEIKALTDTPVKKFLYAHYSLPKYKNAVCFAVFWTVLWAGVSRSAPSANGIIKDYWISCIPPVFFCVSLIVLLVTASKLGQFLISSKKNWFSLSNDSLTQNVPRGFDPIYIMCRSPVPLKNWGWRDTYKCETSQINGNKMPKKEKRDAIEWSYIPLEGKK